MVHNLSNAISKRNCGFSSRNVHIVIVDDGRLLFNPKSDLRIDPGPSGELTFLIVEVELVDDLGIIVEMKI
jgi:hypothetical protein